MGQAPGTRPLPVGPADFSVGRTHRIARDPLAILLDCYERYGPIFSLRVLHGRHVFVLGPRANHYILVSDAGKFHWRESSFGDLIPLLGDGLLTIDGDYHRRARRIMLPAFHRDAIAAATATMVEEAERARRLASVHRDALRTARGQGESMMLSASIPSCCPPAR